MAYYFISDTHFNNENVIKYCGRPFANAEEMNEKLIENWNAVVSENDTVYMLGDFIMGRADTIPNILPRLNGKIILVRGNHDTDAKLEIYCDLYSDKIIKITDLLYIPYNGLFFVCCHFPLDNENYLTMITKGNSEVVLVHGHVHDARPFIDLERHMFNVSVEAIGFAPVSIDTIYNVVKDDYMKKGVWKGEN